MFRKLNSVTSAAPSLALLAAAAGAALPTTEANAAIVDSNSWTITVSADPIGCPGTATVTASFRFKKTAFGGPLRAGTLDVGLWDADPGGIFDPDDHIGQATATWVDQDANFVDLTVTFEVECFQDGNNNWCNIRGNAGADDESDPHEMYIYVEQPNSGIFGNNSWESPKDQGNWNKYSFPLRCGCDEDSGEEAEYDISWEPTGQSTTVVSFDVPNGQTQPPLEFVQAFFHADLDQLALVDVVPVGDGARANDVFGQLFVDPSPGGFFVSMPVVDPFAAAQFDTIGFEILMQQQDPLAMGTVRIHHDPFQTNAFFGDGSFVGFRPVDGEIPVLPLENQPPVVDIQLVELNLQGVDPILVGFPGAVQDNFFLPQPGQIGLDLVILDPNGQVLFEAQKPAAPDGGFDFFLPQIPQPQIDQVILGATDLSGNRVEVPLPFAVPCNEADFLPPYGILDLFDLSAFITAFVDGHPDADLNEDGIVDLLDIIRFIDAFTAGCP